VNDQIEPLTARHDRTAFDSGEPALDAWLRDHAGQASRRDGARTYVAAEGARVVGYYSLCAFSVECADAPATIRAGRQPIPAILLARLAVDRAHQGRGLGSLLLLDALFVAAAVSERIGARVLALHALHEKAAGFYAAHGFRPFDSDPLTLYLPMRDVRRTLDSPKEGC
jgi:GNAT superfamily N-acetyltransferase